MITKMMDKIGDLVTNGTEKDKRIKELQNALSHLIAAVKTYGYMDLYEGNPEWEAPVWLRDGEYTIEKRLKNVRYNSIQIREASHEAEKVLLHMPDDYEDIPPNY